MRTTKQVDIAEKLLADAGSHKPVVEISNSRFIDRADMDGTIWRQLHGIAHQHPRLGSGPLWSSEVLDVRDSGTTVETRNTIYKRV